MKSAARLGVACIGIFLGIGVIAYSSFDMNTLLLLGSLGSSSVLLFAFPDSEFSRPLCVIGGHFVSSAVGLYFLHYFGHNALSLALAVATAAASMALFRVMHPPAGSNPIIVFIGAYHWKFLFFPTLFGTTALVVTAALYHRVIKTIRANSTMGQMAANGEDH